MSQEATKANARRSKNPEYANKYLAGHGIDIGCGNDNIGKHTNLYPKILSCRGWDLEDGDAEKLATIADNTFDFVHSSHCLEHMFNPRVALSNWIRVLKPGGHAVIIIPDEDLYEQGIFPSTFNDDHKWTFTIFKHNSWTNRSINLVDLIQKIDLNEFNECKIISIRLNEENFNFAAERHDQSLGPAECSIEFVVRKL